MFDKFDTLWGLDHIMAADDLIAGLTRSGGTVLFMK